MSDSPNQYICGAMQVDSSVPMDFWFICTEPPGHAGDHEAFGADPLVRWAPVAEEIYELEQTDA